MVGEPTFFFDRCFGKALPRLVRAAHPPFGVVGFDEDKSLGFGETTGDDEWLSVVGQRGWVALSHDKKFHAENAPLLAVRQHKVACFYLAGATLLSWHKFVVFAKASRKIMEYIENEKPPYIFRVHDNGRITKLKGI